jgi:hypothetical protein
VSGDDAVEVCRGEGLDCVLDDRLEDPAGQVTAADEPRDPSVNRAPIVSALPLPLCATSGAGNAFRDGARR